jgi:hypothetical protein
MANIVKVKRSATPAKVPTTSDLQLGEIAVNTYDGKMYIKKDNGTASVVEIGAGGGGSGTVTSVAALTLGTTGADLSSTVANSTTTPVITLNVPTASATNRGALSATDWTTFNNKTSNTGTVTSVGITAGTGVTSSGGPITTSGNITIGLSTKLTAIENLSGAGFFTQNGSGVIAGRTIQAGTGISVAHGNGSSQDPTISNSGVLGVTATSPVASSGGQNPVISMPAATTSVNGIFSTPVTFGSGFGYVTTGSTFRFNGADIQTYTGSINFDNVILANTNSELRFNGTLGVAGVLTFTNNNLAGSHTVNFNGT